MKECYAYFPYDFTVKDDIPVTVDEHMFELMIPFTLSRSISYHSFLGVACWDCSLDWLAHLNHMKHVSYLKIDAFYHPVQFLEVSVNKVYFHAFNVDKTSIVIDEVLYTAKDEQVFVGEKENICFDGKKVGKVPCIHSHETGLYMKRDGDTYFDFALARVTVCYADASLFMYHLPELKKTVIWED